MRLAWPDDMERYLQILIAYVRRSPVLRLSVYRLIRVICLRICIVVGSNIYREDTVICQEAIHGLP
jgi:hypothetical protein